MTPDERLKSLTAAAPPGRVRLFRHLQRAWKGLPLPSGLRARATRLAYGALQPLRTAAALDRVDADRRQVLPRPLSAIRKGRLVVSGYLSDTTGIGRAGRTSVAVLREFAPFVHDMRLSPDGWGRDEPGGVWLCHCNAMEGADFILRASGPRACYRIGYWAWELPNLPAAWAAVAPLFHEIWAPSRFIAEAVERAVGPTGPVVRYMPHPLADLASVVPDRARFGFGPDEFAFLVMYDVNSSATRKNPMGAVKAFQMAFGPERADVRLVIKVVAAQDSQGCLDELEAVTRGWPNIAILREMLSDEDANRLLRSADAFVSLHRAEGFGLSIAQAMAMARPVIVTGWSGNMDFCGEAAILVDYTLIPVKDPHRIYTRYEAPDQLWADPDLAGAAQAMRRLAADPAGARALGLAAQRHVRRVLPTGYDPAPLQRWMEPPVS